MIEYYIQDKTKGSFEKVKQCSTKCWIKVTDPSDEEINSLIDEFKLSKDNILDGLDIHENPRFEVEGKRVYIFLTAPTDNISSEYDSSFLIIYSKELLITISKNPLEIIDTVINSKSSGTGFSFSRQLLKILFAISRMFELSVRSIIRKTKKNKKDLNKLSNKDIRKLIQEEDRLNGYISSFGSIIQTYNKVSRDKTINLFKKDGELIEDLIIDLNETLILCRNVLKTISNMRDYYSTNLSNELNKKVTILTLFTIFLAIPTLISGIYGMNIKLPFQTNSNIIFILALLVVGIWILLFFLLRKLKFI